jgi:hypothetical protein
MLDAGYWMLDAGYLGLVCLAIRRGGEEALECRMEITLSLEPRTKKDYLFPVILLLPFMFRPFA